MSIGSRSFYQTNKLVEHGICMNTAIYLSDAVLHKPPSQIPINYGMELFENPAPYSPYQAWFRRNH
jgi:hypothetical protein